MGTKQEHSSPAKIKKSFICGFPCRDKKQGRKFVFKLYIITIIKLNNLLTTTKNYVAGCSPFVLFAAHIENAGIKKAPIKFRGFVVCLSI
jgi:hypothetical protein